MDEFLTTEIKCSSTIEVKNKVNFMYSDYKFPSLCDLSPKSTSLETGNIAISLDNTYYGIRNFLKFLYENNNESFFRLMYVNFLDFLENEKNIPIDSLVSSPFTVYSYIFSSTGESFYKELKDRFDKPKIFSEEFRHYSLGDLLLGMFDICLEFLERLNENRISSLIMNISNVGVSVYNERL